MFRLNQIQAVNVAREREIRMTDIWYWYDGTDSIVLYHDLQQHIYTILFNSINKFTWETRKDFNMNTVVAIVYHQQKGMQNVDIMPMYQHLLDDDDTNHVVALLFPVIERYVHHVYINKQLQALIAYYFDDESAWWYKLCQVGDERKLGDVLYTSEKVRGRFTRHDLFNKLNDDLGVVWSSYHE